VEALVLFREGKNNEALDRLRQLPDSQFFHTRALEACYSAPRPPGSEQLFAQAQKELFTYRDPEPKFSQAITFNPCLGNDFTVRLMKSAIEGGFCGYDYMQVDPALAAFRKSTEYPPVLAQAKQCRDRFLAERNQAKH
jgi:hypothetical protein